ncbi:MAG: glucan 1,4-alpha-glucosidase [Calditrichaeota bacterium]|nr:MAG: glucan 1,4-alpha-glucosidase [Calditrichota bacterium]
MLRNFLALLTTCIFLSTSSSSSQQVASEAAFPWFNSHWDIEVRLDTLIKTMTLQEKVDQMMNSAPAIERLGIPQYDWWNECLHGVARSGLATVFPQAIGMAATWDSDLIYRVAVAISDEARAKHHRFVSQGKRGIYQGLTFWTPNINLFRDPRWGRGMETYGEDPYLTGQLAVQFIKGIQGNDPRYLKAIATVKHYVVHSGPEPDRHRFDAVVNNRDLRMTYLPHFRTAVLEAHPYSVMCAYNRVNGQVCCGSDHLLNGILRGDWGFEGYVVSDCGAIDDIFRFHKVVETPEEAAALAVRSGTDLNCGNTYRALVKAVELGLLDESDIDIAVRRLFRARMKLGMFDEEAQVPYSRIPYTVVDSKEHQALALETARKSIVLLKNENHILPLSKQIGKIAVIGPNANDAQVLLGNYNGIPSNPVTPLQGIENKLGAERVVYALGCEWADNLPVFETIPASAFKSPDGLPGLRAEFFDNLQFSGEPIATNIDPQIDVNWWDGAPIAGMDADQFSVRWSGKLIPPVDGDYFIGAEGHNAFRFYFEDKQIVSYNNVHGSDKVYHKLNLQAGREYAIRIDFFDYYGDARMRLLWAPPPQDLKSQAAAAVSQADAVVLCMGLSPRLEGEEMRVDVAGFKGGDRLTLDLPKKQQEFIEFITSLGKPTILVLLNGSAVSINWAHQHIPAIVEAWYPGQAAGTAIADALFGDYNPSGRLPVTFYQSVAQLPPFEEYDMEEFTYRFFDGEPLYPFGYGLSYTTFEYRDFQLPETAAGYDPIHVSVDVKNSGDSPGEEVVQLYVSDVSASVPTPLRSLQGFKRVHLSPGENRQVSFVIQPEQLAMVNAEGRLVIEPGIFKISVGGAQPGGISPATTQVLEKEITLTDKVYLE